MSRFEGKLFSIIGDSLSALEGYVTPGYPSFYTMATQYRTGILSAKDMWWGHVRDHFGMQLLSNNAWAGSTVTKMPGYKVESYGCSDGRCASLGVDGVLPDHIFVLIGANDRGLSRPLVGDATDGGDMAVFPHAYAAMLDKIIRNYPDAELWCITMPRTSCTVAPGLQYPAVLSDEHTLPYNEVIIQAARARGCHVIDLFECATPCDTCDALHPDYQGMETLAAKVIADMEATD